MRDLGVIKDLCADKNIASAEKILSQDEIIALLNSGWFDPNHKQRLVEPADLAKPRFYVDEKLWELVSGLVDMGVSTLFSCQGGPEESGYITFSDKSDLVKFCSLCPAALDCCTADIIDSRGELNKFYFAQMWQRQIEPRSLISVRFSLEDIVNLEASLNETRSLCPLTG